MKHLFIQKKFILALTFLMLLASCSRDDANSTQNQEKNFYFLKYNEVNGVEEYTVVINNEERQLQQQNKYTSTSIAVENGDVHVSGYYRNGNVWNATYWVDGVAQTVPASVNTTYTTDNSVFNGKSYISGRTIEGGTIKAKLWVDGVEETLQTPSGYNSFANAISVSNTAIVVGGRILNPNGGASIAVVWENGVLKELTTGSENAIIEDVFVDNTDIYAAGYETVNGKFVGKVWKNGLQLIAISTPQVSHILKTISVKDGMVYSLSSAQKLDGSNLKTVDYYIGDVFQKSLVTSNSSVQAYNIIAVDESVFSLVSYRDVQGLNHSEFFKNEAKFSEIENFDEGILFDFVIK